jgi:hypothetical protein
VTHRIKSVGPAAFSYCPLVFGLLLCRLCVVCCIHSVGDKVVKIVFGGFLQRGRTLR